MLNSYPYSIIDPNMYGIYSYNNNLFTSQTTARTYYSRSKRLIEATNKGWQYALDHPEEIAQIIYDKYSKHKSLDALYFEAKTIKSLILANFYALGSYDKAQLSKNIEMINSYGFIDDDYSLSGLFLDDYQPTQLTLTAEENAFLEQHRTITFSNEIAWYPYDFTDNGEKNGQAMGYSIEYLKLLADKIGLEIKFHTDDWHVLVQKTKNQEIDALHLLTKTRQRESYLSFTKPYLTIKYSLVSLNNSKKAISSLDDLEGKILALGKNWSLTEHIRNNYPNIKILEVNNSKQMLEAVTFGQADASIDDFQTVSYLAQKLFINNLRIKPINNLLNKDPHLRIAFQHSLEPLVNIFEKAMDSVNVNELHYLKNKWFKNWNTSKLSKNSKVLFSPEELAYLKEKSQITVCIDPDWMPLEKLEDGKHVGMTADYFKRFKHIIPVPINVVQTRSWTESIEYAKSRQCDLFSLAMITEERQKYMNFSKPYLTIPLVIATKNEEMFIPDISQITDKKIGIVKGYAFAEILRKKHPEMNIVDVNSLNDGLNKVNNGELFGFIDTLATIGYAIQSDFTGELKIAGKFNDNWELGIATRNDEPLLNTIFNKAISSITPKEHQKILNHWVAVRFEKGTDYQLFFKWLLLVIIIALFISYRNYALQKYNKKLQKIAQTDKLTQLYNRLKIDHELDRQKALSNRYDNAFSVIIVDIDDFKTINDNYGHLTGDSVLIEFALLLKNNIRRVDLAGRWGGEEFLIICPNSSKIAATNLAEKLRRIIEAHQFTKVHKKITASFGIAQYNQSDGSIQKLIHIADKALYQAKTNGRNQVVSSGS
ncbi:MAG: transporter substrate-binding domain-containing protein [gamma proteobacterium symbiont of Bathyaustriella thionipta]|nr:transporter substrate-binding domain-containing protein [gamma proteobacterium symbiont of Bathyaustriella thionipta]MCU7958029.1 transporter substrate-binding domain-containing protein [gamma proteobacterium symbiont of Bathyaustriella thionipta]